MSLDRDLQRALEREEPPDGFENRVMAELSRGRGVKPEPPRRGGTARWVALGMAASLVIAVGAVETVRYRTRQQEIARAERATRDVELALRITSEKLYEIQVKLAEISGRRGVQ